jgi:kynurenine formamidase
LVPIAVVDISRRTESEPDAMVTVDDLRRYERRHGRIPKGALVCMDSRWSAKVDDPLAFKGGAAFPNYHFPGFSLDAAMWLAERRDVIGIGCGHDQPRPRELVDFPGARELPGDRPLRAGGDEQPRPDSAKGRARLRRADAVGGGLRDPCR